VFRYNIKDFENMMEGDEIIDPKYLKNTNNLNPNIHKGFNT